MKIVEGEVFILMYCGLSAVILADKKKSFYMLVAPSNTASIRGIEKAGFIQVGFVKRSKFLRRWEVVSE